jgi:hypothetical protein
MLYFSKNHSETRASDKKSDTVQIETVQKNDSFFLFTFIA